MGSADDAVIDVLVRALAPFVGANMARAVARGHCEKVGITTAQVSAAQLEKLIDVLRPGLNVFVGPEKTALIVEQVRRDLTAPGRTA
jgi:hypothetical protein